MELPLDDEELVVEGFRRSRRGTNWLYRGYALTVSEHMDVDELRLHILDFETMYTTICTTMATFLAYAHCVGGETIEHVKRLSSALSFSLSWIACYIEFLRLDLQEMITFVQPIQYLPPPRNRTIDSIRDNNDSQFLFGFSKDELRLLLLHWRVPTEFFSESGHVFTGEEAMLIFLHYIRTGAPFTRMSINSFGGDPRKFTYYIRDFVDHLYSHFYHKISGDSMSIWTPQIHEFRHAIWNKLQDGVVNVRRPDGSEIDYEVLIPFEQFRVFGWLDDTDMTTTRPRPGRQTNQQPTNRQLEDLRDVQRAFYNRYFRGHGLKAQAVHLPNGMIGSIFICSQRHNDNGVQNLSGLNDYLVSLLEPLYWNGDIPVYPALYADRIFAVLATIVRPYLQPNDEQAIVNTRMASLREDIEHKFSQVFNLYQVLRASWRHQLFYNAEYVRKLFFVCIFVSNCYTCFNESRNLQFNMRAPTIQRYLPLNEQLVAAPELPANEETIAII
jgi:hypothetical protein